MSTQELLIKTKTNKIFLGVLVFFFCLPARAVFAAPPAVLTTFPSANAVTSKMTITGTNFGLPTVSPTWNPYADFNRDGVINSSDLGVLAVHWQVMSGATHATGDANADGKVDIRDLVILAVAWLSTRGTSYVQFSGGIEAKIQSWTDTKIVCEVPYGATNGNVSVITAAGTSNGVSVLVNPPFLSYDQYFLLEDIFNTHLNYFLSSDAITSAGLPLGAYREDLRARYGYSNPTEWGYAMLAWIAAAENNRLTPETAAIKLETALTTMTNLQNNPAQNYQKLFYPYYKVTDMAGLDLPVPYHDSDHRIPSIDNGFLYTSLWIVQGWAKLNGFTTVETKANAIKNQMNFGVFLSPDRSSIFHLVNADTGYPPGIRPARWDVYSDEGGVMAWIMYLSGKVTMDEYKQFVNSQMRLPRAWNGITVEEAQFFNPMFTWGVRSLAGFPVSTHEFKTYNLYSESFANSVKAHLAYGSFIGIDYPTFSDAMTQGLNMRFTPPNIDNNFSGVPEHAVPHALFVPFCIGPDLDQTTLTTLVTKVEDLIKDPQKYYHFGQNNHKPFGLEVTASPFQNTLYNGTEQDPVTHEKARHIFETLSHSYITLSLFQGLSLNDGRPTLFDFANQIPGYLDKVNQSLAFLYPAPAHVIKVPQDYSTIQAAINAAVSGDVIKVAAGTYAQSGPLILNKSGITVQGELNNSIIQGVSGQTVIVARDISGAETVIKGFRITGGEKGIDCEGTVKNLRIENNEINNNVRGIHLQSGANVLIKFNSIADSVRCVYGAGNNTVSILNNTLNNCHAGLAWPNLGGGIVLSNGVALIKDNKISGSWDGAIRLSSNSTGQIINNRITDNGGYDEGAGINLENSTATIKNNFIHHNNVDNDTDTDRSGVGLSAKNSTAYVYNNIFSDGRFKLSGKRGAAINFLNSSFIVRNNIFYENKNAQETVVSTGGVAPQDFSYNNFWGNTTSTATTGITVGPVTLTCNDDNPLFNKDAASPDTGKDLFELTDSSPCINAGDPNIQNNDLNGTRNDMGIFGGNPFSNTYFSASLLSGSTLSPTIVPRRTPARSAFRPAR